ncbi:MAG: GYD domain-containing protein [Caldilineaceae bacterium]|nr:GYD domain-containing protein [Caldilineaceae bacterium]MCB0089311.1 GYD domain-containing protein [Caldilineaceae bacterium]MCB0139717.1 GYD domain-containing protein [Caldilineaceae bacterium]MCB9150331.1 GYD domain-containing protein [Caldilineaceae bacterium]MCB9157053.1 GYD domain-containing protein [Caldilineaceae bacterium]
MALYLYQLSYTADSWKAQIQSPQDVRERVAAAGEKLGGRVVHIWYSMGEYDLVAILEYPDTVTIAAASMMILAGGALKAGKTTPLLTIEDGMEALRKAGEAAGLYKPSM